MNLFEKTSSHWVRYDKYEWREDDKGRLYITPTEKAKPELLEKPTIVWDFHSLLLAIQMMFSFMLTDQKSSMKVCKHCGKVFLASRPNTVFCSGQCKNQYKLYKSRANGRKAELTDEQ